jgi:hypothetical protein
VSKCRFAHGYVHTRFYLEKSSDKTYFHDFVKNNNIPVLKKRKSIGKPANLVVAKTGHVGSAQPFSGTANDCGLICKKTMHVYIFS